MDPNSKKSAVLVKVLICAYIGFSTETQAVISQAPTGPDAISVIPGLHPMYICSVFHGVKFDPIEKTCTETPVDDVYCDTRGLRFNSTSHACEQFDDNVYTCSVYRGVTFNDSSPSTVKVVDYYSRESKSYFTCTEDGKHCFKNGSYCTDIPVSREYCLNHGYTYDATTRTCTTEWEAMVTCSLVRGMTFNLTQNNCTETPVDSDYCAKQGFRFNPSAMHCTVQYFGIEACAVDHGLTFESKEKGCSNTPVNSTYCHQNFLFFDPSSNVCSLDWNDPMYNCSAGQGAIFDTTRKVCTDSPVDRIYCLGQGFRFDPSSNHCTFKIYYDRKKCAIDHGLTFDPIGWICTEIPVNRNYCLEHQIRFDPSSGYCTEEYYSIKECAFDHGLTFDSRDKGCSDTPVNSTYCHEHSFRFDPSSTICSNDWNHPIYACSIDHGFMFDTVSMTCTDSRVDKNYCLDQGFRSDPSSNHCTLETFNTEKCGIFHGLIFDPTYGSCTTDRVNSTYCHKNNLWYNPSSKHCTSDEMTDPIYTCGKSTFDEHNKTCTDTPVDKNYCLEQGLVFWDGTSFCELLINSGTFGSIRDPGGSLLDILCWIRYPTLQRSRKARKEHLIPPPRCELFKESPQALFTQIQISMEARNSPKICYNDETLLPEGSCVREVKKLFILKLGYEIDWQLYLNMGGK